MDYNLFGRIMELVHLDPFWGSTRTSSHTNSIYYAVKHGKVLVHFAGDRLVGFCTYGFFTEKELEGDNWFGEEVYSRKTGDVLFFPKFQCRAGRREVIRFIRDIQGYMYESYPGVETAGGLRVYPEGRRRSELWHRKIA